jgi:hypothetical protein
LASPAPLSITLRVRRILERLDRADFTGLFVADLGWTGPAGDRLRVTADGTSYEVTSVASYGGSRVWACPAVPSARVRRALDRAVRDAAAERLLIFHDAVQQLWLWPQAPDAAGEGPARVRTYRHAFDAPGRSLVARLAQLEIVPGREPSAAELRRRLRRSVDGEAAAKRFHRRFADRHERLAAAVEGLPPAERDWYAALLMCRLMAGSFLRRAGVPGHAVEEAGDVRVPDAALAELFAFFDEFRWRLGDHPTGHPDEVDPGVLGHVFEQVVNRRHGAYYTKPDVTGYLVANTVTPLFLERLAARTGIDPWRPLREDPGRYVWESLAHGAGEPLPADVAEAAAADPAAPHRARVLDARAADGVGLPGETWWETLHRRRRADGLRGSLAGGGIRTADDAVTANLDLETLAVDVVDALDTPDAVLAAWDCLSRLRILDPTCGSGAFLLAALDHLHTLYGAVLDAARRQADHGDHPGVRRLLAGVGAPDAADRHLLAHAAGANLFGIDLLPEAAEIARLRVLLRLAAAPGGWEGGPLPDLRLTIRAGNLLGGSAWLDEFPAAAAAGGFDVVLGNPPYESPHEVAYPTAGHRTADAPDIYAMCVERAADLLRPDGRLGMVVMASLCFGREYRTLRNHLAERFPARWVSSYARIPQGLFAHDTRVRNSIVIGAGAPDGERRLHTARLRRWEAAYRPHLLPLTEYARVPDRHDRVAGRGESNPWPFLGVPGVAEALWNAGGAVRTATTRVRGADPYAADEATGALTPQGPYALSYKTTAYNYLQVFVDIPPRTAEDGTPLRQTKLGTLWFRDPAERDLALTLLASRWAFAWWTMYGDDFDVTGGFLGDVPVDLTAVRGRERARLLALARELRAAQRANLAWKRNRGLSGRWDMSGCRDVLERIDVAWARQLGVPHLLGDLALAYYGTVRTASA